MISAAATTNSKNSGSQTDTLIRNLEADFYKFQRHNVPFTITNNTTGTGTWDWKILDLGDNSIYATSSQKNPQFTLPEGNYLVYLASQGLNPDPVARVFWNKRITVLPVMFTEGEADRVLDLDNGNNIFDATTWGDGERIYVKAATTVGRLRINNFTSATKAHILIDEPMTFNSFVGSHGIYLVNCQNVLIDAVGLTDEYYITLDGIGENTSHAINLNLVSDIRCEFIEIYGVDIQVDQSGASGIRVLGDESATYNRNLAPCQGLKFAHIKGRSGAEFGYIGYTADADTGDGGPRQFEDTEMWDIDVETCVRDPIQPCSQINGRFHDWRIADCATSGEPSHNSYVSYNSGNQNCKIFNITGKGGMHGLSVAFGETGANAMFWNIIMEVETLPSQSSWNFTQTDAGATTDLAMMNITLVAKSGDEIVNRLDASGGNTRDIDDFTLINCTTIKGTSANFFTKDGTNAETNWDRTSGNLTYIPATAATALLDATTHLPSSVSCPSIDGGVSKTTRRTAAELLADFGTLEFADYDINGYIVTDGEYFSGAGSGIELKLAAL